MDLHTKVNLTDAIECLELAIRDFSGTVPEELKMKGALIAAQKIIARADKDVSKAVFAELEKRAAEFTESEDVRYNLANNITDVLNAISFTLKEILSRLANRYPTVDGRFGISGKESLENAKRWVDSALTDFRCEAMSLLPKTKGGGK
jgi:hypothetical protein